MRYAVAALLALSLSTPIYAQRSFDLGVNYVWMDPTGAGEFEDVSETEFDFDDAATGYGASANVFFGDRISAEFAIANVSAEATGRRRSVGGFTGDVDMMPVTAVLQFHFAPNGFIDPYVGGGAAYVLFDDFETQGVSNLDRIDIEDDVGFAINAGIGIRLGGRIRGVIDAKYIPLEANATAVNVAGGGATEGRFDVSPIIISAGIGLSF
ncbi:MAG TPA: OmpW family outer membrane protein [Thermoanaerobaculia bacterium]|jgi:outer membrane protein